jgi:hypothetical protein
MEWMSIAQWAECRNLQEPDMVFEIRNAYGQSLFSVCTPMFPEAPTDWLGPPIEFRLVSEVLPRHSSPLPKPAWP